MAYKPKEKVNTETVLYLSFRQSLPHSAKIMNKIL